MSLINIQPWLLRAQREHFALGAFNMNTLEQAQAIVAAAEQERAPVIIQISQRTLEYVGIGNPTLGLRYLARIGTIAAESVSAPIALHLDHAMEEQVLQLMALGFTSAMFDGGDLPFEENIRVTKRLCERAHALGVCIEAELGEVPRADSLGNFAARGLTDPASLESLNFFHSYKGIWFFRELDLAFLPPIWLFNNYEGNICFFHNYKSPFHAQPPFKCPIHAHSIPQLPWN